MDVKLDPRFIEAVNRGEIGRRDWKAIAKRVEAAQGQWQMVFTTKRFDHRIREEVEERLRSVGCRCQVVVGVPANQTIGFDGPLRATPDRVVFARIPHSVIIPGTNTLI